MDLHSMLKREDFFGLFFPTIESYYDKVLHKKVKVTFASKDRPCNGVIKPYLSALIHYKMSSEARSFFYAEWNIRKSRVKNILVKLYVFLVTHCGMYFAEYKICITPEFCFSPYMVIAPNNRSIRFFDYKAKTVGCICKAGFSYKFMTNQLRFRKMYNYSFMVPLIDSGENWFVEPILYGHPLARISKNALYNKGMTEAIIDIHQVAFDSLKYTDLKSYSDLLIKKIKRMLTQAQSTKKIKTSVLVEKIILKIKDLLANADARIILCLSHGDFQSGNIWLDQKGKIWIYDWETVELRSIWYDSAVLLYSLRRANGWKEFYNDKDISKIYANELENKQAHSPSYIKIVKAIVLLEDIIFYLDDMLELPEMWGNKIFDGFIKNVSAVLLENDNE